MSEPIGMTIKIGGVLPANLIEEFISTVRDDISKSYPVTKRPQCVMQALISTEKLLPKYFRVLVKEALGYSLTKAFL